MKTWIVSLAVTALFVVGANLASLAGHDITAAVTYVKALSSYFIIRDLVSASKDLVTHYMVWQASLFIDNKLPASDSFLQETQSVVKEFAALVAALVVVVFL